MTYREARIAIFAVACSLLLVIAAGPAGASHTIQLLDDGFENEPADSGAADEWTIVTDATGSVINVTTKRANTGTQSFYSESPTSVTVNEIRPDIASFQTTGNASWAWYYHGKQGGTTEIQLVDGNDGAVVRINDSGFLVSAGSDLSTTALTDVSVTGEWIEVKVFNIDTATDTYSVRWSSTSDSGTQNNLAMAGDMPTDGYTDFNWISKDAVFMDDVVINQTAPAVSGTVRNNKTQDPVNNARVEAWNTSGGNQQLATFTTTDANGDWSLHLESGEYTLVYNRTAYYYFLENVTVPASRSLDVGTQNITPIPTAYTNADPRGGEYIRNRTRNAFNITVTTREPDGTTGTVTSRFMWYNQTSNQWEQFNSITWTRPGPVTHDFEAPHDWNPGPNRWFINTSTSRGNFHSSNYTFITPGNITFVNASDTSETVTNARITATISSLESSFQVTRSTASTGVDTWDGKVDLNDIPREDMEVTITQTDGATNANWRDRTLIIDDTDIDALWTVALVNQTVFTNQPEWYLQSFELDDQTGEWDPKDTYLFLLQRVGFEYEIVAGDQFGIQNDVTFAVNDSEDYRMVILHAVRGDTREMGTFEADRSLSDTTVTLTIEGTTPAENETLGYFIGAEILNDDPDDGKQPLFRFEYNDSEVLTYDLEFTVHKKGNTSIILRNLENVSFDKLGSTVFTQQINQSQAEQTWVVNWSATRDGKPISGEIIVGGKRFDPGTGLPDGWQHWASSILIILVGALFGGKGNAKLGMIVTPLFAGTLFMAGWMPVEMGLGIVALALVLGGMIIVANHRLGD